MSTKEPLSAVKSLYNKLELECKTENTKQALKQINDSCNAIYKNGGQVSIPAIVTMLNSSGFKITKRTIYNKDKKTHPYPLIINAWIEVCNITDTSGKLKSNINLESDVQMISDDEFKKITDHALRYKVSLMAGQIKGLSNQLNTVRSLKNQPLLNASDALPLLDNQTTSDLGLDIHEIDILKDFIKTAKSKSTDFDEDDSLIATKPIARNDVLSQPGLKDIISKIIKSYTLPDN